MLTDDTCCYCRHPKHPDIAPEPMSRERCEELWAKRSPQHRIPVTAGECAHVKAVWDTLPGEACWMNAFWHVARGGKAAAAE